MADSATDSHGSPLGAGSSTWLGPDPDRKFTRDRFLAPGAHSRLGGRGEGAGRSSSKVGQQAATGGGW